MCGPESVLGSVRLVLDALMMMGNVQREAVEVQLRYRNKRHRGQHRMQQSAGRESEVELEEFLQALVASSFIPSRPSCPFL